MKIKATKTLATAFNKAIHGINFTQRKIPVDNYRALTGGDPFTACENGDFDDETSTINALKAVYTDETALPRYLTTEQLKRLYKDGDTLTDYINRVYDYMEI